MAELGLEPALLAFILLALLSVLWVRNRYGAQKTWYLSPSGYKENLKHLLSICFLLHQSGVIAPTFPLGKNEKAHV